MKTSFRITRDLLTEVHNDLSRPHPFAAERVGFISCGVGKITDIGIVILAQKFHPVANEHYINDLSVGAMMGSAAIRIALQFAYQRQVSMFHVHRHEHYGQPRFSRVDLRESARYIPDFWKVRPNLPHGTIVLSHDSMFGLCWHPGTKTPVPIDTYSVVGRPTSTIRVTA